MWGKCGTGRAALASMAKEGHIFHPVRGSGYGAIWMCGAKGDALSGYNAMITKGAMISKGYSATLHALPHHPAPSPLALARERTPPPSSPLPLAGERTPTFIPCPRLAHGRAIPPFSPSCLHQSPADNKSCR